MMTALMGLVPAARSTAGKLTAAAAEAATSEEARMNCRRDTEDEGLVGSICIDNFRFVVCLEWRSDNCKCSIIDEPGATEIQSLSTPLVQSFCICSGGGTLRGRTMRKPTHCASEKYQTLLGNWGSCAFHERSEPRRAALRHIPASSSQEPPRTECG